MDAETGVRAALSDAVTVRELGDLLGLVDAAGYTRLALSPINDPHASPYLPTASVSPAG